MTTKAKVAVKQLKFKVPIIVEPDTPGFHAYSPALKGLHMGGDTKQEALENARDAAMAILEVMIEDGIPIPLSIKELGTVRRPKDTRSYHEVEVLINYQ